MFCFFASCFWTPPRSAVRSVAWRAGYQHRPTYYFHDASATTSLRGCLAGINHLPLSSSVRDQIRRQRNEQHLEVLAPRLFPRYPAPRAYPASSYGHATGKPLAGQVAVAAFVLLKVNGLFTAGQTLRSR